MQGKWKGQYWYLGNVPEQIKNRKTSFIVNILPFTNSKINGTIEDDLTTGGTEGIGEISGNIKGDTIQFVKKMPIQTMRFKDGTKITKKKPHVPIYYSGTFNQEKTKIKGTWKIKFSITFHKWLPYIGLPVKGEWEMEKV